LGVPFAIDVPGIEEDVYEGETPLQLVLRLSEGKARAVAARHPASLVIGSDQIAVMDGRIVGKPEHHDAAVSQLQRASGKKIDFLTGLCVVNTATDRIQLEAVPFSIHFRELDLETIERYLRKDEPYNCAGSFRSERLGVTLFERMEGDDPTTVVGLPLIRLVRMLEREGVALY